MLVSCLNCGVQFKKKPAEIKRSPHNFCSKLCYGADLGRKAIASFSKRYVLRSGCWEWIGSKNACGYGTTKLKGKSIRAHQLSWVLHRGPIPSGMQVLHRCDNPPCVNPEHLWLGTHADNMADKVAKGRARRSPLPPPPPERP